MKDFNLVQKKIKIRSGLLDLTKHRASPVFIVKNNT